MKRPLAAVVSFYALGILLAKLFQPPLTALWVASFLVLAAALVFGRWRPGLLCLLLALAGATNLMVHTAVLSPNDLRALLGGEAAIVSVRGTLAETPHLKIMERDAAPVEHSLARVRVRAIRRNETWQPADGDILVSTPSALPEIFFAGQAVEISGVMAPPPPPLADGLFDFRQYLATRGIYFELKTASSNDWTLREPIRSRPPLTDRFLSWARRTLAFGLPAEDELLRLLWAMTLGWRTAFTSDIREPFLRAGTMHLFAIDGLRIALLSGMIVTVLRVLRLSRAWCGAVAVPLIWFYTAATGWESSAIRASVMMTIVLGGWALKRPGDTVNSLAAAAFLILLLWDPRQLFEAGFQLSFFVVLIIALLLPPLNEFFDRLLRRDPLLPEELVSPWRRGARQVLRVFLRYCGLSLTAWLGSIPLAAMYFHLFSPVSTPANIIAVPLGTLALMANLGALVCGAWLPWATALFNHAAWFFMVAMQWVSVQAAALPGAFFYVPAPSWILAGIYYAALAVAGSGVLKTPWRKTMFAALPALVGAVLFFRWELSRDRTEVFILPLRGGHAVFVDAAGRDNDWLVDCGDEDAVNFILKDFLRAQGVNRIPHLILTEGRVRNGGGAGLLDENFHVGELWTSAVPFRSGACNRIVAAFEQSSRHRVFHRGDQIGAWKILWPENGRFPRAGDAAAVLLGNFSGTKILLLSDLSRASQSALLAWSNELRADIVVAGLPDAGEPLGDALIEAVRPKAIVIADSEFPATRRASRQLQERLAQTKIPVIYTRDSGAVKITADKAGWKLRAMDGRLLEGRAENLAAPPGPPTVFALPEPRHAAPGESEIFLLPPPRFAV